MQPDGQATGARADLRPTLPGGPGLAIAGDGTNEPRLLLWDGASFHDARAIGRAMDDVVMLPPDELRTRVDAALRGPEVADPRRLRAPVGGQEVWAAGVTYRRSEEARIEESASADAYARVYSAERPELFYKAAGWRVVEPGGHIGIRADSAWDVPEPELALLVGPDGAIRAYACANDVSSRSIEGENPLYLPQAKVYDRSCAIGPVAVPWHLVDPNNLTIRLLITRSGDRIFEGETAASAIVRPLKSLIEYLLRSYTLPLGAWLLTGTGVVPPSDVTLRDGDIVDVSIDGLGVLRNPVRTVGS